MDRDEVIRELQSQIRFLMRRVERLERENEELKACLYQGIVESTASYREMSSHFTRLQGLVFRVIRSLSLRHKRPVSNEEIIRAFRGMFPMIKVSSETITRRVRELKAQGAIRAIRPGLYVPVITTLRRREKV